MQSWASEASHAFVNSTPTQAMSVVGMQAAREWTRTTRFLRALQTDPPKEFDWKNYAPLIQWMKAISD